MKLYSMKLNTQTLEKEVNEVIEMFKNTYDRNSGWYELTEYTVKTKLNWLISEYCFNDFLWKNNLQWKWLNIKVWNNDNHDFEVNYNGKLMNIDVKWLKVWEKRDINSWRNWEYTILPIINLFQIKQNTTININGYNEKLTKWLLKNKDKGWNKDVLLNIIDNMESYLNINEMNKLYLWRVIFDCNYSFSIGNDWKVRLNSLSDIKYLIDDFTKCNYLDIISTHTPTTEQPNNFKRDDFNNTLNYKIIQHIL